MTATFRRNRAKPRVAIVGSGITGLLAAVTLRDLGMDVQLYEQSQDQRLPDAGTVLGASAVSTLKALGVTDAIAEGHPIRRSSILDRHGRTLQSHEHEASTAVAYGDLERDLAGALPEQNVHRGKRCVACIPTRKGATLIFDGNQSAEADAVIGCDGVYSVVRPAIFPATRQRFAGYTCWRGIATRRPPGEDPGLASESWGRGRRFGLFPLGADRSFWFACVRARKPGDPALAKLGLPELRSLFADFHAPVTEVLAQTPEHSLSQSDVFDIEPMPYLAKGRLLVLGDAAHASVPDLGEGIAEAFEDVRELAEQLAEHAPKRAFARFSRARVEAVGLAVKRAHLYGMMTRLQNPLAVGVRDFVVRVAPSRFALLGPEAQAAAQA